MKKQHKTQDTPINTQNMMTKLSDEQLKEHEELCPICSKNKNFTSFASGRNM